MPLSGCRNFEFLDQRLEAVAVLGEVDGIGRCAQDRHAGSLERLGELQRGLAAELHDDAAQGAFRLLHGDDLEHVFGGQRLEIEPVGGVVVGRDRFGIAVDHDGLGAGRRQRKAGVAAAIVELDALPDAVGAAAQDDDLVAVRRRGLVIPVYRSSRARRSNTCRRWARRILRHRCRCACRPGAPPEHGGACAPPPRQARPAWPAWHRRSPWP